MIISHLKIITLLVLILFSSGCNRKTTHSVDYFTEKPDYAERFYIDVKNDVVVLIDESKNSVISFDSSQSRSLDTTVIDRISPRYICLSSTHIAFLTQLGEEKNIVGTTDSLFIFNTKVESLIRHGDIQVVSNGAGLNEELILELEPTVIFTDRMRANEMNLFIRQGIPVVYIEEYREVSPLARAEWLRVFGHITGKIALADSVFSSIEDKYLEIVKKVQAMTEPKPTIFGGMEYQGVWYISGGKSYISELYAHAGASYLFLDNDKSASIPRDFEVVYDKGANADFWRIIYGSADTIGYDDLGALNIHYRDFLAYKNKNVILCNPSLTPYFELGVLEPHIILSDLVYAIHPELLKGYHPKYYYILK